MAELLHGITGKAPRPHPLRAFRLVLWLSALSLVAVALAVQATPAGRLVLALLLSLLLSLLAIDRLRIGGLELLHSQSARFVRRLRTRDGNPGEVRGMCDRDRFLTELERARSLSRWFGTPSVLVLAEIDGLDEVRERCGDSVGGHAIQALGADLRRLTGPGDLLAYGGDGRFWVLLGSCPPNHARRFLEAIPSAVALHVDRDDLAVPVIARSGPLDAIDVDDAIGTLDPKRCLPSAMRGRFLGTECLLEQP